MSTNQNNLKIITDSVFIQKSKSCNKKPKNLRKHPPERHRYPGSSRKVWRKGDIKGSYTSCLKPCLLL